MIGIDPGASGGAVLLDETGGVVDRIAFEKMTDHDIANVLTEWTDPAQFRSWASSAIIEKVGGGPVAGRHKGSSGAFSFGRNYGFLIGLLTGLRIPYRMVTPQTWQKAMGCLSHGDKNVTKAAAQRLWPNEKWTHAIADAALIGEFGRRTQP